MAEWDDDQQSPSSLVQVAESLRARGRRRRFNSRRLENDKKDDAREAEPSLPAEPEKGRGAPSPTPSVEKVPLEADDSPAGKDHDQVRETREAGIEGEGQEGPESRRPGSRPAAWEIPPSSIPTYDELNRGLHRWLFSGD